MHPWQQVTIGSGLTLHAPLSIALDPVPMQREFAALDAATGPEGRMHMADDGSWSSITLLDRHFPTEADGFPPGTPTPALRAMPSVSRLLDRLGCRVVSAFVHRQAPGGLLSWHFDVQALHLGESRLIVPILAPPGAVTRIGDEAAAYPPGVVWTGDFSFPHQVENAPEGQRIVLLIDVRSDDHLRSLAPEGLSAQAERRIALSERAVNILRDAGGLRR